MDRTDIIAGPAIVTFDSQVFYFEGDIEVTPEISRFDLNCSAFGKFDERLDNILWKISGTPVGQWKAGHLPVLWPHQNPALYTGIFGSTDKHLTIQTLAGKLHTYKAAAIEAMPEIICSATKTPIGAVTWRAIGANDTAWSDAAKRALIASSAFADTSFSPADVPTVPFSAAWGSAAPWNAIETEDGWNISFEMSVEDKQSDGEGIYDGILTSVGVMAKCVPVGVTAEELLALLKIQGTGIRRGVSLNDNAADLVITGSVVGSPLVTVYNCAPVEAGYRFGQSVLRQGELGFVAVRKFASGAPGALFNVASVLAGE